MIGRHRHLLNFVALGALMVTLLAGMPLATAQTAPASLRLFAADSTITLLRYGRRVALDMGVYATPVGGDFQLRVWRDDYDSPIEIAQFDGVGGEVSRALPPEILDEWNGLDAFTAVTFTDAEDEIVAQRDFTFCPNGWDRQRVDDGGEPTTRYPFYCGSFFPFVKGMVWGIERSWATPALSASFEHDFGVPTVRVPAGTYTVTVGVTPAYQELFGVAPSDATVELQVTVKQAERFGRHHLARERQTTALDTSAGAVPDMSTPPATTLPDLVALPAFGMRTFHRREKDLLGFATTLWNAGPAPMVVEGFRRSGEDVMDAYQYFYEGDKVVGRASVGTMAYDERRGHNHWHFEQFASFSLLDHTKTNVVKSTKQSFCIVPTDAVDLTVAGADWNPYAFGFGSACGGPRAIWVREVLEPGWGDTYYQQMAGQSFNITNVPNGWYYVEVRVNATESLYQTTTENDVEHRLIYLGGKPGARRVMSAPWHGITV
ncbi:MAG: lysyl oxidase family protein [Actinomycetota bacterium]